MTSVHQPLSTMLGEERLQDPLLAVMDERTWKHHINSVEVSARSRSVLCQYFDE